jgi:hypothetical protein
MMIRYLYVDDYRRARGRMVVAKAGLLACLFFLLSIIIYDYVTASSSSSSNNNTQAQQQQQARAPPTITREEAPLGALLRGESAEETPSPAAAAALGSTHADLKED